MTDETREDFEDEPEEECSWCGEMYPQSQLDEDGRCPDCAADQYEEEEEDGGSHHR